MPARKRDKRRNTSVRQLAGGWSGGFLGFGSAPRSKHWVPNFETLEGRNMLAGGAVLILSNGALTISEAAGTVDSLTIAETGGNYAFVNTAGFASASGLGVIQPSNDEVDIPSTELTASLSITLGGKAGNDLNFDGSGLIDVSNVSLSGVANVSEGSFEFVAQGLAIDTSAVTGGTIELISPVNNVAVFAAKTDGGSVEVATPLIGSTIGTVGNLSGIDTTDGGVNAAGADVIFEAAGALVLAAKINAGHARVQLESVDSGIQESPGATITAGSLAAIADAGRNGPAANINLGQANVLIGAGNSPGIFAASNQSPGGMVNFNNIGAGVAGLQIGSIALANFLVDGIPNVTSPLQGVATSNPPLVSEGYPNTINLSTVGNLTIAATINAGNAAVSLNAVGAISESTGDTIFGGALGANVTGKTAGNSILLNQSNFVNQFSASDSSPGGSITLNNSDDALVVGSGGAGITTTNNASGPFTNNINLQTSESLQIAASINAGFAEVELLANINGGPLSESNSATITAGSLLIDIIGTVDQVIDPLLPLPPPIVSAGAITLAQHNTLVGSGGAAGVVAVLDPNAFGAAITIFETGGSLQVGSLSGTGVGAPTISGISAGAAEVDLLTNAGSLNIAAPITSSGSVMLAAAGSITEASGDGIAAASLLADITTSRSGNYILLNQVNALGTSAAPGLVAAHDSSPGGSITIYNMGGTLQVDALNGGNIIVGTVSGVSTTNTAGAPSTNNVNLWSNGKIILNNQVNAGFGQVTLHSPYSVTEAASTGGITAGALAVLVDGNTPGGIVFLNQVNHFIARDGSAGLLAVEDLSPGGAVTIYNMGSAMQVDSLNAAAVAAATISGISTTNAASGPYTNQVNLWASGAIVLNSQVNAGFAPAELRAGGSMIENAGHGLTAGSLVAIAGASDSGNGIIVLNQVNRIAQAGGAPGLLAAEDNSPGASITIYNMGGTLQVDALSASGVALGTITGIGTANGNPGNNINLWDNTSIILNASLDAGFAEVELRTAGSITENANATIAAGSLGVSVNASPTASNVSLGQNNVLAGTGSTSGLLAIVDNTSGGSIVFVNGSSKPLHETTLSMAAVALTTVTGVSANGGSVNITPTPT